MVTGASGETHQRDGAVFRMNIGWLGYRSFSQQKNSMTMRMGYPVLQSGTPVIGLYYQSRKVRARHDFFLDVSIPSRLDSDNGTGRNELLDRSESSWFRSVAGYTPSWNLIHKGKFQLRHGVAAGVLFEYRKLGYLSGAEEQSMDFNLYTGPALQGIYRIGADWQLAGGFDGLFYLPFLNYGNIRKSDTDGNEFYASPYHGFYYQTNFWFSAGYKRYMLGVMKTDLVGYANPEVSFGMEGMNHFKFDKIYQLKITIQL